MTNCVKHRLPTVSDSAHCRLPAPGPLISNTINTARRTAAQRLAMGARHSAVAESRPQHRPSTTKPGSLRWLRLDRQLPHRGRPSHRRRFRPSRAAGNNYRPTGTVPATTSSATQAKAAAETRPAGAGVQDQCKRALASQLSAPAAVPICHTCSKLPGGKSARSRAGHGRQPSALRHRCATW